jgi:hypothetical protein
VVQFFNNITTEDAFNNLKLPIKNVTKCPNGSANNAYEIDLEQRSKIEEVISCNKMDCFPVLVVFSALSKIEWTI